MSWGSNYSSNLKKLTVKQNNCVRSIFFVNNRQSTSPYYQLFYFYLFYLFILFISFAILQYTRL